MKPKRRLWTQEEDKVLKELAGLQSVAAIAVALGRSDKGVHGRLKRLKLSGRLKGELHWNAKLSNLQSAMIITLVESGYSVKEIKYAFDLEVSLNTLHDLAAARTWKSL